MTWEHYTQDDEAVTIEHERRGRYRVFCSCGWRGGIQPSETLANNAAMSHVLDHDARGEE